MEAVFVDSKAPSITGDLRLLRLSNFGEDCSKIGDDRDLQTDMFNAM